MNSMYFSANDVESGLMTKLIDFLTLYTYDSEDTKVDIHIKPDDVGAFVVEWECCPWDNSFGGRFEFVDRDEFVTKEICYPDGTYEYCPEYDVDEAWSTWLSENPGWHKDDWGQWVNKEDETLMSICNGIKGCGCKNKVEKDEPTYLIDGE